ncbi:molybdopterin-dependent oxidoreductase [Dermatobacter hominis]|uniref:molybdopterin-dependent oxidoreductase n=1 Tax=Dermatobacter hominis TaxID=2884263 RepID=UPI001D1224B3|nr:molybdopterin-dependent oxidoreductase [Dermatobacter hominis]UDY36603.1 molybdopterin-dependent oxidoreductase [Dermatobacter hominis]
MTDTTVDPTVDTASGAAEGPTRSGGEWHPTACILCECNCGIEVRLGPDGRTFERIRGDKAHPASQGYTCEKALRLDHYQNGPHRLDSPMRRRPDGTYEAIDWDTAIAEVAAGFARVRDRWGGASIFYYGGGGQGNHLSGGYSTATRAALGSRFRSNALAQEKTGEFWVNTQMLGAYTRGDVEHAEVSVWVGKNPWQSHSIPHARTTLKEIARDPQRSMVVIDPRRTETAELADFHLAVRPGTDAWCLAALAAVLVQEDLVDRRWFAEHGAGLDRLEPVLAAVDVDRYAGICDVDVALLRATARRIAGASSVAVYEDLGVQMGLNSTLCSYLDKLLWALTGNFAVPGGQYVPTSIVDLAGGSTSGATLDDSRRSPVVGAPIIGGLVPCNVIAEEILTDHPDRYRAMLVESANPLHSLADSPRMREALDELELVVVIDVAMTETAQRADYVLPASSQYEKAEATFFNFEFPDNHFHLRRPFVAPLPGTLPEPEIHARIVEALGVLDDVDLSPLAAAAEEGREAFGAALTAFMGEHPDLARSLPVILYRTLGPTLPEGTRSAALLWGAVGIAALQLRPSMERAGFEGEDMALGDAVFQAILDSPSGVVFSSDDPEDSWARVATADGRIHVDNELMIEALAGLATADVPGSDPDLPLVLSAGERRSFTANTIFRGPAWRKRDAAGALRVSEADAAALGLADGDPALLSTERGTARVVVEVSPAMRAGHISLPNGLGVTERPGEQPVGVAPNELTSGAHRDPYAGTPHHKHVPARLEPLREPG